MYEKSQHQNVRVERERESFWDVLCSHRSACTSSVILLTSRNVMSKSHCARHQVVKSPAAPIYCTSTCDDAVMCRVSTVVSATKCYLSPFLSSSPLQGHVRVRIQDRIMPQKRGFIYCTMRYSAIYKCATALLSLFIRTQRRTKPANKLM